MHADLDAQIDDLYRRPLTEFTAARNALVKTQRGADASRVRKLAKPTVVAWAANQVYWHARAVYDRLVKSGEQVRKAQIAALEGRPADVRAASDAHRRAIGDAVQAAQRLASASGSQPGADALMRTFEALSLAPARAGAPGRLTEALQPAGFEALTGVTPAAQGSAGIGHHPETGVRHRRDAGIGHPRDQGVRHRQDQSPKALREQARRAAADATRLAAEAKREAAEERKHRAAVSAAEAAVERARSAEALARTTLDRAVRDLRAAEERLARIQSST